MKRYHYVEESDDLKLARQKERRNSTIGEIQERRARDNEDNSGWEYLCAGLDPAGAVPFSHRYDAQRAE